MSFQASFEEVHQTSHALHTLNISSSFNANPPGDVAQHTRLAWSKRIMLKAQCYSRIQPQAKHYHRWRELELCVRHLRLDRTLQLVRLHELDDQRLAQVREGVHRLACAASKWVTTSVQGKTASKKQVLWTRCPRTPPETFDLQEKM